VSYRYPVKITNARILMNKRIKYRKFRKRIVIYNRLSGGGEREREREREREGGREKKREKKRKTMRRASILQTRAWIDTQIAIVDKLLDVIKVFLQQRANFLRKYHAAKYFLIVRTTLCTVGRSLWPKWQSFDEKRQPFVALLLSDFIILHATIPRLTRLGEIGNERLT